MEVHPPPSPPLLPPSVSSLSLFLALLLYLLAVALSFGVTLPYNSSFFSLISSNPKTKYLSAYHPLSPLKISILSPQNQTFRRLTRTSSPSHHPSDLFIYRPNPSKPTPSLGKMRTGILNPLHSMMVPRYGYPSNSISVSIHIFLFFYRSLLDLLISLSSVYTIPFSGNNPDGALLYSVPHPLTSKYIYSRVLTYPNNLVNARFVKKNLVNARYVTKRASVESSLNAADHTKSKHGCPATETTKKGNHNSFFWFTSLYDQNVYSIKSLYQLIWFFWCCEDMCSLRELLTPPLEVGLAWRLNGIRKPSVAAVVLMSSCDPLSSRGKRPLAASPLQVCSHPEAKERSASPRHL